MTAILAIACIGLIYLLIVNVGGWFALFDKAGKKKWASIIPVYREIVLFEIVNRPMWWIVFFILPIMNILFDLKHHAYIVYVLFALTGFAFRAIIYFDLAKCYGKGKWFAFGLIFLPFIFIPILGLGKSVYTPITR